MNLSYRHVAWAAGFIVGCVVGVVAAPSWELAPIFVGIASGITAAISAQVTVFGNRFSPFSLLATVAGSAAVFKLAQENPSWVVHRCVAAVIVAGLLGTVLGILLGRRFTP